MTLTNDINAMPLYEAITAAESAIRSLSPLVPRVAIILGTGLGALAEQVDAHVAIDYQNIPGFPLSTVESHKGRLILGTLESVPVAVLQGRFHVYEGYSQQQITFPLRVLHRLGARTLFVSNACGGMNPIYRRGDVMIMEDHINLLGGSPLIGPNDERLGPRFPDMSEPYSKKLIALAQQAALELQHYVHRGVYVAVPGPNLETRAEYRFLRGIGADVVGMSTVPETIAAVHMGMDVLGMSIITDECFPDSLQPVSIEDVLAAAKVAEPVMTSIIRHVIRHLS
ncbi:MAG: purine-nucleoside phosphorylase [Bradyrhizobiaceae bacterium]|nr:purine-nucleoside phosphorylase [Bradyrhizobiaceae bacterium]